MDMRDMIQCDACSRAFSVKAIRLATRTADQYSVNFFVCPLCGRKYNAGTTDTEQRELLEKAEYWKKRIQIGRKKRLTQKTIRRYQKKLLEITDQAKARNESLKTIGDLILIGGKPEDAEKAIREG